MKEKSPSEAELKPHWVPFFDRFARPRSVWIWGVIFTVFIEAFTFVMRFSFDFQTTRDTAWLATITFGWRIHHGYWGVAFLCTLPLMRDVRLKNFVFALSIGLIVSDLIHHFLVLWPLTGSPHFDIRYPAPHEPTESQTLLPMVPWIYFTSGLRRMIRRASSALTPESRSSLKL